MINLHICTLVFLLGMVIHIESKVCGLVYISFKQENVLWLLDNVNQKCCWLNILSLTVNPLDIIVKGVMIVTLIRKYGSIITNIASVCLWCKDMFDILQ